MREEKSRQTASNKKIGLKIFTRKEQYITVAMKVLSKSDTKDHKILLYFYYNKM